MKKEMKFSQALSVLTLLYEVVAIASDSANCSTINSCSECMRTVTCVWCLAPGSANCFSKEDTEKLLSCKEVIDPKGNITVNQLPLDELHQVSVESVQVNLRAGRTYNFTVSVKSAENFPLDLYILMDFSNTFGNVLESAKNKAGDIVSSLQNVTSQFQVGFGKFTDKATPPYTSYTTLNLDYEINNMKSSCRYVPIKMTSPCGMPIPYEHVVTLTNSSADFSSAVKELIIEGSTDDPEGILDAMMQAVVCTGLVGWREEARKVLLVMTDDVAHIAGDGKLAAIHTPNDGQCHTHYNPQLNKTVYTASLDYDYPSLEHIRLVLQENEIVPVFAVNTENLVGLDDYYGGFSSSTEGFYVNLDDDSENLVDVIREAYTEIVSNVRLVYDPPAFVTVTHEAECPSNVSNGISCSEIGSETANFTISLRLSECQEQNVSSQITFRFPGFGNFLVDVEGICECNCEQQSEQNSTHCSNNGNITCGKCSCFDGWEGEDCSCSKNPCPLGPNGKTCSGEGVCICGQCQCDPVIPSFAGVDEPMVFGPACECNNFRCDTDNQGVVCSGRGTCQCSGGEFHCECGVSTITGYQHTGGHCQCSHDNCIDDNEDSPTVCSGHGTCSTCSPEANACTCSDNYSGEYCQFEVFEISPQCNFDNQTTQDCVSCFEQALTQNVMAQNICPEVYSSCLATNFMIQDEGSMDDYTEYETIMCSLPASAECDYQYLVAVNSSGNSIYVVEPKECLLVPIWAIVVMNLVGLLVIGGVILALAKLVVMYHDYVEVQEFNKELKSSKLTRINNPMYQAPTVTYKNVIYQEEETEDEIHNYN